MWEGGIGVPVVAFHDAGARHLYYAVDADVVKDRSVGAYIDGNSLGIAFQCDERVLCVA